MAPLRYLGAALALYTGVAIAAHCEGLKPKSSPQVAPGLQFKVLANNLQRPRGIVFDPEGNLLVVEGAGKGIRRIVLDDGEGLDTCVVSSKQLVAESSVCYAMNYYLTRHAIHLYSRAKRMQLLRALGKNR